MLLGHGYRELGFDINYTNGVELLNCQRLNCSYLNKYKFRHLNLQRLVYMQHPWFRGSFMGRRYKGRVYQGMKPNSERQFTSKVFMQGAMSYLWRHKHFMKDCPHNEEQVDVNMNVHITLLSPNPESMQKSLVVDSLGNRLLDTGCWQFTLGSIN